VQEILGWIMDALAIWGYPIVFLATLLENVFLVGSFTPGDIITAGAAVAAATEHDARLSPWALLVMATLGSFVGTNISYLIGRRGGREMIERLGPKVHIDVETIKAAEEYFEKHGVATVFLAKFVAVLKNVIPAIAGASKMNLFFFELYSLAAALLYSAILVGVGWFLGDNFRSGLKYFGAFSWLMLAAVVTVGLWLFTRKRRHDRRLVAKNAAEYERAHADGEEEA
jgi:membrane-associated protein